MALARALDRRDTAESTIFSAFGSFGRLKVSQNQLAYTQSYADIQLAQNSLYIPVVLRGADSSYTLNGGYAGRLSINPKAGAGTNQELVWAGQSPFGTGVVGIPQWGLFVRAYGQDGSDPLAPAMGLTQKTDPLFPDPYSPTTLGQTHLFYLEPEPVGELWYHRVVDDRGATTTTNLDVISPLGAVPSTDYSRDFNSFCSFVRQAGTATIIGGQPSVQVAVPHITASSIVMLTWADNNSAASVKLWPTVPVAGTLQINTAAPVGANTDVDWFVAAF